MPDNPDTLVERPCTCHPDDAPRYCAGKYALSDCLRSELEAAQHAADYFAASFFAEQARLIKSESALEAAQARNAELEGAIEDAIDTLEAMDMHVSNPLYDRLRAQLERTPSQTLERMRKVDHLITIASDVCDWLRRAGLGDSGHGHGLREALSALDKPDPSDAK
jgi:hypothetical protein